MHSLAIMKLTFAAVVAAGWLALADTASACKCWPARGLTAVQVLADAGVLFTGTAIKPVAGKTGERPSYAVTTFRVTEAFKCTKAGQLIEIGHRNERTASCGVQFEIGEPHTLGPTRWKGEL
jgi:hypothetical protein